MEGMDVKIQDVFRILKRRWRTVVGMTLAITLFVAVINFFVIKPVYEVKTTVFIGKEENSSDRYDNDDVQMYQRLLKTYSALITTKNLIGNAIKENNLNITPKELMESLEIVPNTDTQILEISYKSNDKALSKDILLAVVNEFVKESKELIPNGMVKVMEDVELPQNPISPKKGDNTASACFVGFMMGIAIALLMEYMDDTFKTKEQTEKIMELPVIGMIPCGEKN